MTVLRCDCRTGTAFSLGKAEGFREQFYVQAPISTGGGRGGTVRFGKEWQTPSMVMFSKDRAWTPPPPPSISQRSRSIPGRRGKQRLLSQKETFGPIKWQLSKLQENSAKLRLLYHWIFVYFPTALSQAELGALGMKRLLVTVTSNSLDLIVALA